MPAWTSDGRLHDVSGPLVVLTDLLTGLRARTVESSFRYLNHDKIAIDVVKMRWFFLHADLGMITVCLSPRLGEEEQRVRGWFEKMITSQSSTDTSQG